MSTNLYIYLKRVIDIFFAILGIAIMLPTMVIVKAAYLIHGDTASIFYSQKRVGLHGREFCMLKFRSMVPDADKILQELLKEDKYRQEWAKSRKFKDDPRITKVGKILRKTSLDELPQFVNILMGDMSLIGPRPLAVGELEEHEGLKLYQSMKPGITGWWACNGRNDIDYPERLELEYYYIRNHSLYLDILCIFRTVLAVVKTKGAE